MASRFAVLSPEVDLDNPLQKTKKQEKPKPEDKPQKVIKPKNTNSQRKKDVDDLHALAYGYSRPKPSTKPKSSTNSSDAENQKVKTKKDAKKSNVQPDVDWKRRDEEYIRDENERSLREAIILSKLDYEEKKGFYEEMKKESEEESKKGKLKKRKKEKPIKISLEEFNNLQPQQVAELNGTVASSPHQPEPEKTSVKDRTFFKDVDEAARKTMEKESRQESYKLFCEQAEKTECSSKYEEEIEKRDFEIQALRLEVEALRDELNSVNSKYKRLREVVSVSEVRSKCELVLELEKITKARDEFAQEVTKLSAELEQEKTRVSLLTADLKRSHGRRKQSTNEASKD